MTNADDMNVELPVNKGEQGDPSPTGTEQTAADAAGSENNEKVDRAWHNKRLEKEGKKRAKAVAEAKELRARLAELERKEAERSAGSMEDLDVEMPEGFEELSKPMQKAMSKAIQKARYDDSGLREALGRIEGMITANKYESAFKGLTEEQREEIEDVRSETNLSDPKQLIAVARAREPELFNGVQANSGHYVNSGGRGSARSTGSTVQKQIADLERQMEENPMLRPKLGPQLLALHKRLGQGG